jgi:multidrug efflux system membrane fusion protein
VDTTTGTIQLKAVLDNGDESLTPGQFVSVSLVLETLKDAVVVSADAVQQGQEGSFIYVVQADGTVKPQPVTVLATQGKQVAVGGDLAAGATVVTEGQLRLTPGAKIQAVAAKKEETKPQGEKPAPAAERKDEAPAGAAAPAANPAAPAAVPVATPAATPAPAAKG